MKKRTIEKFGYKFFLLGKRKDGQKVWLREFKWDCGWYWGGGYIEIFTKNGKDIQEHLHFDDLFLKGTKSIDAINDYFKETVLSESEWWQLLDLFNQFYSIKKCAEVLQYGGGYSIIPEQQKEKNIAKKLNKYLECETIPLIVRKVAK